MARHVACDAGEDGGRRRAASLLLSMPRLSGLKVGQNTDKAGLTNQPSLAGEPGLPHTVRPWPAWGFWGKLVLTQPANEGMNLTSAWHDGTRSQVIPGWSQGNDATLRR
jgi:hypothetical protein